MKADEDRFRKTEQRLWASVGLAPNERWITHPSGARLRIQEGGPQERADTSPVLFVHGTGSSGAIFAPLLAKLPDLHWITLDRPGCGLSEPILDRVEMAEFERLADNLIVEVLDGLALASARVVATSFGSYFAVRGAAAQPDRIDRMALLAYVFGAPIAKLPMSMRLAALPGMDALMGRVPPNRFAVKIILRQLGLGRALADGRFTEEMLESFLSVLRDTPTMLADARATPALGTFRQGINPEVLFRPELLARVGTDTLLLWGDEDPMGGVEVAEPFAAQLPNSQLELLAQCGHAPWIDEPDRCAELLLDFLGD